MLVDKPLRPAIGWREWIALPGLSVAAIKAKVDTGARSSSLHAFNVEPFDRNGAPWVRFEVHPLQRDATNAVPCEAAVLDYRDVRSSTGHLTRRPVICTEIDLGGNRWPIELTLAPRDEMGFRMLLGREAIRGRFVVEPARSYLLGKRPPRKAPLKKSTKKKKRPSA